MSITRRKFAAGTAAIAAATVITRPAGAQTVIRWGELLPTTHPQVQMLDRIAKEVKEKSSGRIEVQSFPNGQLGSAREALSMRALRKLGRPEEARLHARLLLDRDPETLHAEEASQLVEQE